MNNNSEAQISLYIFNWDEKTMEQDCHILVVERGGTGKGVGAERLMFVT